MIDWLEQAPDLPHLIARVSELVLSLGHAPEDLVVIPRAELDRRELAAYSAGWADVVDEELPAVRQAYEQRITAAYLQGQEDARTGRRPRRARRTEDEDEAGGGEVIPLPYVRLLAPPDELTRVEQRGERERTVAGGAPAPGAPGGDAADDPEPTAGGNDAVEPVTDTGSADILLSARELRERRPAGSERRPVLRRNGRPSVPPLARQADAARDKSRRADPKDPPSGRDEDRPRLSDRARALADELEGRVPQPRRRDDQQGPPVRK
ncbi:hypothetical protein ACF09H_36250 [Streptomyces sp. NPDC014983]|uniref:hypothetical protein n=1 Tax=Streptomyces sp. NPDC014983 TaxID=3364933 RepID=UPI0036F4DB16